MGRILPAGREGGTLGAAFQGGLSMKTSTERILTTHTGSLPRPAGLADRHDPGAVRAAVRETVTRQREAGVDIVNDGEVSKPSYATYVTERLSGFAGEPVPLALRGFEEFPEFAQKMWGDPDTAAIMANPSCDGPVAYLDQSQVQADIANLLAAADGATEVFMSAASPGVIEMFMANRYYPSTEEYLFALADAMKQEYDAISQAGLILQLDCPDLACEWALGPEQSTAEFRQVVAQRIEALDYATRDIPPDRLRMHLCWGNYEGPHHTDVPLADIIDLVLAARPAAVSFEAANPRHEHEWTVFEQVKLPEGKALIPGVLDSTTNYIEHPELVAQRIIRYAGVAGRENVIAGSDCGFATFAAFVPVDPKITWAKLAAMAEGARLASQQLWKQAAP
jgi:5-methyltetrahydropteroyltriglutamate--homocysteine methyltransferase